MQFLNKRLLWALLVLANVEVAQDSSSLLWEARSGNKTVFLFGTIHVGRPDFIPCRRMSTTHLPLPVWWH